MMGYDEDEDEDLEEIDARVGGEKGDFDI